MGSFTPNGMPAPSPLRRSSTCDGAKRERQSAALEVSGKVAQSRRQQRIARLRTPPAQRTTQAERNAASAKEIWFLLAATF